MTEAFDFTPVEDRLQWSATKWEKYRGRDVIPLWIADMDFAAPPAVQHALAAHVAHGNYGYMSVPRDLPQQLADDYRQRYGWAIEPQWIVWLPGLVLGLNLAVKACCEPGEGVIAKKRIHCAQAKRLNGINFLSFFSDNDHRRTNSLRTQGC